MCFVWKLTLHTHTHTHTHTYTKAVAQKHRSLRRIAQINVFKISEGLCTPSLLYEHCMCWNTKYNKKVGQHVTMVTYITLPVLFLIPCNVGFISDVHVCMCQWTLSPVEASFDGLLLQTKKTSKNNSLLIIIMYSSRGCVHMEYVDTSYNMHTLTWNLHTHLRKALEDEMSMIVYKL